MFEIVYPKISKATYCADPVCLGVIGIATLSWVWLLLAVALYIIYCTGLPMKGESRSRYRYRCRCRHYEYRFNSLSSMRLIMCRDLAIFSLYES